MKAHILAMPETNAELRSWLEAQLGSPDFLEVVAELAAIPDPPQEQLSLDELLGSQRAAMLERGLVALDDQQLSALLSRPRLLLELQDLVFTEGGSYWDARLVSAATRAQSLDRWPEIIRSAAPTQKQVTRAESSPQRRWVIMAAVLSTAAVLLIAVGVMRSGREEEIAWGWAKPGAFAGATTSKDYLAQLASGADGWFAKRPTEKADVERRIEEFRIGCQRLLAADHRPLSADDKAWLLERCGAWQTKIDQHLADVRAGEKSPAEVRSEMDETVRKLRDALSKRAELS